jgi:ADP-ribosylglycohydrolase
MPATRPNSADRLAGALLGTAVGDAIGLPREGLRPERAARRFGAPPLRHALWFGRGMMSDDTEHACMTLQAICRSGGDPNRFARSLGWRLRGWLLGLPGGVGLGTLRAILKLWMGFPPSRSGVNSEGNGPCMRAPVIGAWCAAYAEAETGGTSGLLGRLVKASTNVTHRNAAALEGAKAVAVAASVAARSAQADLRSATSRALGEATDDASWRESFETVFRLVEAGAGLEAAAAALQCERGVSGWVRRTVPAALYCHLAHPGDVRGAVEAAVMLGGDTDTVAAIAGGLAGAAGGTAAIPPDWLDGLLERPRSVAWMRRLAARAATAAPGTPGAAEPLCWPMLPLRNACFLAVVVGHGLRRLLPPY